MAVEAPSMVDHHPTIEARAIGGGELVQISLNQGSLGSLFLWLGYCQPSDQAIAATHLVWLLSLPNEALSYAVNLFFVTTFLKVES